jgi:hypothetical protein
MLSQGVLSQGVLNQGLLSHGLLSQGLLSQGLLRTIAASKTPHWNRVHAVLSNHLRDEALCPAGSLRIFAVIMPECECHMHAASLDGLHSLEHGIFEGLVTV